MNEITQEHSTNTPYHIFVLYKMASVNNVAGNLDDNESVFERITEIAPMAYQDNSSLIFRCHNTLLKYYLNRDVDKCCQYGEKLLQGKDFDLDKISAYEKYDLYHTLGTAYGLEGTSHEKSFECYDESLKVADQNNEEVTEPKAKISKGYALNNLGMGKFWYFMEKTREISQSGEGDRNQVELQIQQYADVFEQGIKDIKNSVIDFEEFDTRFEKGMDEGKLSQIELKMKLFVDEFFDTGIRETVSKDFQYYDLKDNQMNVKFVSDLFRKSESCLPIANLGEISLIFNKMKEAMAFLDIALKIVGEKDPNNLISNKIISDLSGIVDLMGQTDMMIKMNSNLLKGMRNVDDYIKVLVLRNYGHLLTRHKEHQDEGKKYIQEADDLDRDHPYWAERKLCLFTPTIPHEPLEKPM